MSTSEQTTNIRERTERLVSGLALKLSPRSESARSLCDLDSSPLWTSQTRNIDRQTISMWFYLIERKTEQSRTPFNEDEIRSTIDFVLLLSYLEPLDNESALIELALIRYRNMNQICTLIRSRVRYLIENNRLQLPDNLGLDHISQEIYREINMTHPLPTLIRNDAESPLQPATP